MIYPDIPTAMTRREAQELYTLAKGKRVVEFGSLLGYSTIIMAQSAQIIVSVDPHEGYPITNPRPTYNAFRHHLKAYNITNVIPVVGKAQDIWQFFNDQFDMAFIDMDSIVGEILEPIMRRIGTCCVHDYGHPEWMGATLAVDVFLRHYPGYKDRFRVIDTLAVIG